MTSAGEVIILYASVSADHVAKGRTEDLQRLFDTKGVPYSLLDGTQDVNRELRNALFSVSGKRAVYPQAFIKHASTSAGGSPSFAFAGLAEEIQELADEDARSGGFAARFGALMRKTGGGVQNAVSFASAGSVGMPVASTTTVTAQTLPLATHTAPSVTPPLPAHASVAASTATDKIWHRHVDRRTGDPYWWCPATRESSWVDPNVAVLPGSEWVALSDEKRGGRKYYYSWRTGASSWSAPPGYQP